MNKQFTKQDLQTGDIVELRNELLGVVILEKDIILYQQGGYDDLDMFNDNLTSEEDGSEFDIVCVYRGHHNGPTGFGLHIDEELIYCRDKSYIKTYTPKQQSAINNNNDFITVVMQAMYGNRTYMKLREDEIDAYILGHLSSDFEITEPIDRSIIRIPHTQCIIVYNKYQEEEDLKRNEEFYKKRGYMLKHLAHISELNTTLYSRCLMCRIDENNNLASIQNEDYDVVNKYLSL